MERIVIEVSPNVARAWRKMPEAKKKEVSLRIGREFFKDSKADFLAFIDDLQKRMAERGLTQEKLDEILRDEA